MRFSAVWVVFSVLALVITGCGRSEPASPVAGADEEPTSTAAAEADAPEPTDVVARFLDSFRRGGGDGHAAELLTESAREQCEQLQLTVQPIGTPDATFSVTRAEMIPGREDAALVHSVWTEPSGEGESEAFQVVWAVKREGADWRISGLVLEAEPGQDPLVIDFENREDLARHFGGSSPAAEKAEATENARR